MNDLVPIVQDDVLTLGMFELGQETVAIDVRFLAEVAHIESLKQRIVGDDSALGMISIRGVLVPVIDPLGIYRSAGGKPSTAAVLTDAERVSGLAVSAVKGLRRFAVGALQKLSGDGGDSLTLGTICEEGSLIHVLNAEAILRRTDIPKAYIDPRKTQKSDRGLATPLLTFEAGGVSFAMKADKIVGTVPQRGIEDVTMAGERFLGTITYYDRRVPIMSTNRVFGLGLQAKPARFETVVLRFPDDRLLGLTADRIVLVANSREGEERALSSHVGKAIHLVRATVNLNETAHFIIDDMNLLLDAELISVAGLSDRPRTNAVSARDTEREKSEAVVYETERYLLAEAGLKIGIRMTHIDGMRSLPSLAEITRTDVHHPGLMGLFLLDGEMIPLIRLAEHLGRRASPNAALERIFISSDNDRRVAFLVDSLTGIATSEWTTTQTSGNGDQQVLASLRAYGTVEVRNIVDLRKVSRDVVEQMFGV